MLIKSILVILIVAAVWYLTILADEKINKK